MTLVLPYGPEQIGSGSPYSRNRNSPNMPCVFDSETLDFESALLSAGWNSDMSDYGAAPADDFSPKAPSDDCLDLKRKSSPADPGDPPLSKKPRADDDDLPHSQPEPQLQHRPSDADDDADTSPSCSSSSSSSSSSSDNSHDEVDEDEEYVPRRRGPQMWNSRQRWKDERKRVLKLSVAKLAEIEDPELCMHRSVVINNTVRRLHADIRGERQAKMQAKLLRQRHFFHPLEGFGLEAPPAAKTAPPRGGDAYDDSSCDEIFGVSEDFLRVTIPDRRTVSSPIPAQTSAADDEPMDMSSSDRTAQQSGCCPTDSGSSLSSAFCNRRTPPMSSASDLSFGNHSMDCSSSPSAPSAPQRRVVSNSSGQQCATQFRTSRDMSSDFPPRVPILDSVVYHSLLASLESS